MKRWLAIALLLPACFTVHAEDAEKPLLTILYTAESHAALLPCDCPLQPLGGVARRATLIKRYRARGPVLLLDGGGWGAGGMYDEESDGDPKRDALRTTLMAQAMKLMQYDFTAVGQQESGIIADASKVPARIALSRPTPYKIEGFDLPLEIVGWSEPGTPLIASLAPEPPKTWDRLASKDKKSLEIHLSRLGEAGSDALAGVTAPDLVLSAGRKTTQRISWIRDKTAVANFDYQAQRIVVIEVFPGPGGSRLDAYRFRVRQEALGAEIPDDPEIAALLKPHLETLKKKSKQRVQIEYWTMPECPGCIQALPDLQRVAAETAGRVDITLHFVLHKTERGEWGALHGARELAEARIQAVVQKHYPDGIWAWLEWRERNRDIPWEQGAKELGMLATRIRGALNNGEAEQIFAADYDLMQRRRVEGTPTLIIANRPYEAPLERQQILRVLCGMLDAPKPAACNDVPACFYDSQCRKRGTIGRCIDAGKPTARCDNSRPAVNVPAVVVIDRENIFDNHERILEALIGDLPGLDYRVLDLKDKEAQQLLIKSGISRLPAYFLDEIARTEAGFDESVTKVAYSDKATGKLIVRPFAVAAHRVGGRQRIKGRLDLFVSRSSKNGFEALEAALEHVRTLGKPAPELIVHDAIFWKETPAGPGIEAKRELAAIGGLAELEEAARGAAVRKIAPEKYLEYLLQAGKRRGTTWWDVPLRNAGIDPEEVRKLAEGPAPEILAQLQAEADLLKALETRGEIIALAENVELIPIRSRQDLRELIDKLAQRK
ncbi:MAG TPA: hypothetical protein VEJ63_19380 [Planctomycetota bacterium]|nr:hypothetical protein [Planctomycetota bacterium]